ncbi:hypothetical protein HRbin22_00420 [Candidatus Thermoflexus japonica]|uniref:Uncharacterized protein n=1 Tax=Candidatus Thermoflexus japonica TaxID=2035417 RepID=A0A2H5Y430_9CHLR|nr:hypothetical protein HRbin22_00420 [Candidatus Thermoflexus japonica]
MWNLPSGLPDQERFERTVQRLLQERGEEIEFLVLFGSIARGDCSWRSDDDLLLGLREADGLRLIDRILHFTPLTPGGRVSPQRYTGERFSAIRAHRATCAIASSREG